MGTYQSQHERTHRQDHRTGLQHFLLVLIILCTVGITSLIFVVAREYLGNTPPVHHATPTPVISASPTSTLSPTPTPSSAETPTPTPTPPPGVLGYPLYTGNPHLPAIALTFDDGPNPPYTSQILAILQLYDVQATFFVIGSEAAAYPDLVQQEYQQGNSTGNHTWSHPNLINLTPTEVRAQLTSASNQIAADTGAPPTLFRPPGGSFNSTVQSIAASLGLSTILWNVDPKDWSRPGTDAIIKNVLSSTHNGSIILMHDGGGDRSETVAALPTIITALEKRGFQFVTIPHMIQDLPPQATGPTRISPGHLSPELAPIQDIPISKVESSEVKFHNGTQQNHARQLDLFPSPHTVGRSEGGP